MTFRTENTEITPAGATATDFTPAPRLRSVRRARRARRNTARAATRYAIPGFNRPRGAIATR